MKEAVTRALEPHDDAEQSMHAVIIRKIDPAPQRRPLQKVIQIIRLRHEQQHVERIVEPRGRARDREEDHREEIVGAYGFPGADAALQSSSAAVAPRGGRDRFRGHARPYRVRRQQGDDARQHAY